MIQRFDNNYTLQSIVDNVYIDFTSIGHCARTIDENANSNTIIKNINKRECQTFITIACSIDLPSSIVIIILDIFAKNHF